VHLGNEVNGSMFYVWQRAVADLESRSMDQDVHIARNGIFHQHHVYQCLSQLATTGDL
jgi:hypothetical protein